MNFSCPYDGCLKLFGSESSQSLHIRIKHNGGSKTQREKLALMLVKAFANNELSDKLIKSVNLNLPPGLITKVAIENDLIDKVNEIVLLDIIYKRQLLNP